MNITKPTLLLDERKCRNNIRRMAEKARQNNVLLRPHFKTPQSATIGNWFREEGVTACTVSSVSMAQYFIRNGWRDITIAFPFNHLEVSTINEVTETVSLNLFVESVETVRFLQLHLTRPVGIFLKIDSGNGRTGILYDDKTLLYSVANAIKGSPKLVFKGIASHAGHAYKVKGTEAIGNVYHDERQRMLITRHCLLGFFDDAVISIGDTPACSIVEHFEDIHEIRPGNFIFFDWMQYRIGSCNWQDIAVCMVCPVVAKHPERQELVVYGGAIHFSKDFIEENEKRCYGQVVKWSGADWGGPVEGAYMHRLSQEHGIVKAPAEWINNIAVGDAIAVLPIHSCLTANLMKHYQTLNGKYIKMMPNN